MSEFTEILHVIGQALKYPCIIILLLLLAASVWQAGDLIGEFFLERRRFKENVPELLKKLSGMKPAAMKECISQARLLKKQKAMLLEMAEDGADMPENARAAFAQKLLEDESAGYDRNLRVPDLVAKIGPMFGLLGTLIPLGPGIEALGQGDTAALSASLGIAFDTTIAGMIAAAVCSVIGGIRRRWYDSYESSSEAIAEFILENLAEEEAES